MFRFCEIGIRTCYCIKNEGYISIFLKKINNKRELFFAHKTNTRA